MALIIVLDVLIIACLVAVHLKKGFEFALSVAAALLLIVPNASRIPIPGLFDLTSQRIIILVLLALHLANGRAGSDGLRQPLPLRFFLGALIAWMLLSSAMSVVPAISFKSTLSQYFDFALLYIVCWRSISSAGTVEKLLSGLLAGSVVCTLFGLLEIYFDWHVVSLFPEVTSRLGEIGGPVSDRGVRVQASFDHPILFGSAMALAAPIALYLLSTAKNNARKIYCLFALLLVIFNIYKTGSRGPWLALLLSVGLLLLLGKSRLRLYTVTLVIFASLLLMVRPAVQESILILFRSTLDPETPQGESYQWRYVLYHVAREELGKSAGRSLWGFGPESFFYLGLTTEAMVDGEEHTVKVDSCDSAFVELMMDTGYVGLLLVLCLLGTAMGFSLYRYLTWNGLEGSFYLVTFINLCAFVFLMSNVELFGWGQQTYMLWVVVAIAMSNRARLQAQPARASARVPVTAWGAAG